MVEFSPATREARVRFPASATHIVFSLVKPFFSFFFPLLFQFFPARELCRSDQKKKKKKKPKKVNKKIISIIQYKEQTYRGHKSFGMTIKLF